MNFNLNYTCVNFDARNQFKNDPGVIYFAQCCLKLLFLNVEVFYGYVTAGKLNYRSGCNKFLFYVAIISLLYHQSVLQIKGLVIISKKIMRRSVWSHAGKHIKSSSFKTYHNGSSAKLSFFFSLQECIQMIIFLIIFSDENEFYQN